MRTVLKLLGTLIILAVVIYTIAPRQEGNVPQPQTSTENMSKKMSPEDKQGEKRGSPNLQKNEQKNPSAFSNNSEAEGFARSATEISRETWLKGQVVWRLDLTPQKITGRDIVSYRKKVTYCKATISINHDEWFQLTETSQRNYIKSCLNILHKPPLFMLSKVIDYYPNSSGEVSIFVDNKIVATGNYSKTATNIVLNSGTYKPDEVGKYSVSVSVVFESSGVKFNGTTNIPDSTSILFTLSGGKYRGQSKVVVNNGAFSTEIFSKSGYPLPFGKYSLSLNTTNPMLQAKGTIVLPDTKNLVVTFSPTKF
jgi:hypothetical protein